MRLAPLVVLLMLLPTGSTWAAATPEVRLAGGAFAPNDLEVQPGDSVRFVNADDTAHTVTSAWDDGATFHRVLKPGQAVVVRFDQAGTYVVRCVPHSSAQDGSYQGMVASVHVVAPGSTHSLPSWVLAAGYATAALSGAVLLAWQVRRIRRSPQA